MNLLALVYYREVSLGEAERLFDTAVERFHESGDIPPWDEEFEFSNYEATAYLSGATLADLAKVRYEGWPTSCCRCSQPLDYRLYGWWFVHSADGVPRLRHIECPAGL